jgi:hypothetical protein
MIIPGSSVQPVPILLFRAVITLILSSWFWLYFSLTEIGDHYVCDSGENCSSGTQICWHSTLGELCSIPAQVLFLSFMCAPSNVQHFQEFTPLVLQCRISMCVYPEY